MQYETDFPMLSRETLKNSKKESTTIEESVLSGTTPLGDGLRANLYSSFSVDRAKEERAKYVSAEVLSKNMHTLQTRLVKCKMNAGVLKKRYY